MCGGPMSPSGFPPTVTGLTAALSEGQSKHVRYCDNTSGFAVKKHAPLRKQEPFQSSPAFQTINGFF